MKFLLQRNENRRKNSELKKAKLEQQNALRKGEGISVLKLSQLNTDSAGASGTKFLIVNTNKVPLNQQVNCHWQFYLFMVYTL